MATVMAELDEETFEHIYRMHWEAVYAICYHYTESRHVSEDLVQEIFQSLWERKNELVIEVSIEHYLLRAARLKVFSYLRTYKIRQKHQKQMSRYYISAENFTENDVLFKEISTKVSDIVNELPSSPKTVYILSRTNGMKNNQIAKELNLSEKTVKNHLTRALQFLRLKLNKEQP